MIDTVWMWLGFNLFVLAMLALDLEVFHRKAHVVAFKESIAWTVASSGWPLRFCSTAPSGTSPARVEGARLESQAREQH